MPHGWSLNEKERSWKVDVFRHQNFENRTKIEGVMALTIKISWTAYWDHHYTSPFRSEPTLRWCLHWVFWKILIVKAITPSILVRFSKFWCLNIIAFQDLSFSFTDQPRGTCPRGQKRVLKLVHENKNHKIWKKWTSRSHSAHFFLQVNWKVFRKLKF